MHAFFNKDGALELTCETRKEEDALRLWWHNPRTEAYTLVAEHCSITRTIRAPGPGRQPHFKKAPRVVDDFGNLVTV